MGEVSHYRFTLVKQRVEHLHILEHDAPAHLLVAHMEQLYGLEEIVGEISVKLPLNRRPLGIRKMGETFRKIVGHHLAPVAGYVIKHYKCGRRQRVESFEGEQSQTVEHPAERSVKNVFESGSHIAFFSSYHTVTPFMKSSPPAESLTSTMALNSRGSAGISTFI